MINPKRRFTIVIVDGASDVRCLKFVLSNLYERINPSLELLFFPEENCADDKKGDITSKYGMTPEKIAGYISGRYIDPVLRRYGDLPPECIMEIIHVIDMDGAYIDDSSIKYDAKYQKFYYGKNEIRTAVIEHVIKRNRDKRKNIDYLCSLSCISFKEVHIPYSVYFFSSNLDHVICGDANLDRTKKFAKAKEFAKKCNDNPEQFLKAIELIPGTLLNMTYEDSWDYIRKRGSNSINPHTNINILIRRLLEQCYNNGEVVRGLQN